MGRLDLKQNHQVQVGRRELGVRIDYIRLEIIRDWWREWRLWVQGELEDLSLSLLDLDIWIEIVQKQIWGEREGLDI